MRKTGRTALLVSALLVTSAPAAAARQDAAPAPHRTFACEVGTYGKAGGEAVSLRVVGERVRYLFTDGRRNWVDAEDSPVRCGPGTVLVQQPGGTTERWERIRFRQTETRYDHSGVTFFGRLIEPAVAEGLPPLVVFAHGSERDPMASGPGTEPWPGWVSLVAAQGVAAFVFDKRGTGESGGEFTMDFHRLADDLAAASSEARRLADGRYRRFGISGASQGGWVSPLAARAAGAEFLIVNFGALYSPIEEDAEEVRLELERRGYGADVIAKARRVTDATARLRASNFAEGVEELARVRREYGEEPWFAELEGEFTGTILGYGEAELRTLAGSNPLGIPWEYDGIDVVRSLRIPQLWTIAEEDRIAPIRLTVERLETLQAEGRPIQMAIFPDTDHGIIHFAQAEDGSRTYTNFADGYFRLLADWAKGRLDPPYGSARLLPRAQEAGRGDAGEP